MTSLTPEDDDLHYADGTHRWLCQDQAADSEAREAWSSRVRRHMAAHLAAIESDRRGLRAAG